LGAQHRDPVVHAHHERLDEGGRERKDRERAVSPPAELYADKEQGRERERDDNEARDKSLYYFFVLLRDGNILEQLNEFPSRLLGQPAAALRAGELCIDGRMPADIHG